MAFYTAAGSFVAFGGEDDNNIYLYLPTWTAVDGDPKEEYTVESANPLANLPLIGVQMEDGSYVFYTATGAAKFTFTDIPEGAAYIAIELSDDPLSGFFTWDEEGIITNDSARKGTYTYTGSDGNNYTAYYSNHYVIYHFDRNADGTGTVYMPLPVGRISAGSTVSFYDEDLEEALYSRPLRADVPIERNKVTEVASFSASYGWESLGAGAYWDEATFYYMDQDNRQFAGVEVFKDANMPGSYRISNPYPGAAEDRGYTIPDRFELPEYVSFTVMKDNYVVYEDIHTGYNEDDNLADGFGDWFLGSPSRWTVSGSDNSFNFIAKYQEDGTPELMVLSPFYIFDTEAYGAQFALGSDFGKDTWKYMLTELYFPGAESQYALYSTVSLKEIVDDNPAQPTALVALELASSDPESGLVSAFSGADLVIATDRDAARELLAAGEGTHVTESGEYRVKFPADAPNGLYYAYAMTVPAEGFTENCALLFDSDDAFEYFRSDEDRELQLEDIIGTYSTVDDYWASGWTTDAKLTMVVDENADPLSGYPIEFSNLCPELAKAIVSGTGTAIPHPVNATFDTEHGVVTIPRGQVAYTIKDKNGSKDLFVSAEHLDEDIELFLREPGVLEVKTWLLLIDSGNNLVGCLDYELPLVYTREGTNYSPARSPRRHGYNPFRTPLEKQLGMYPEVKKSKPHSNKPVQFTDDLRKKMR
jgi:hypothetical protein